MLLSTASAQATLEAKGEVVSEPIDEEGWFAASSCTGVGDTHAVDGMAHHQHDRGTDGGGGNYPHAHEDIIQSIPVPADRIGWVIGKEGSFIKQLEERSKAAVRISDSESKEFGRSWKYVGLQGTPRAVDRAKKLLHIRLERLIQRLSASGEWNSGTTNPPVAAAAATAAPAAAAAAPVAVVVSSPSTTPSTSSEDLASKEGSSGPVEEGEEPVPAEAASSGQREVVDA